MFPGALLLGKTFGLTRRRTKRKLNIGIFYEYHLLFDMEGAFVWHR